MKITVEVEVPDVEDCGFCEFEKYRHCIVFNKELVCYKCKKYKYNIQPCEECLTARKGCKL